MCRCLPMLGGEGFQGCRRQQFLKLSGDKFQFLIDYIIRINNGKFLIMLYHTNKKNSFCLICKNCIQGVFSEEGGGHFAGMPMVAGLQGSKIVKICRRLKWMVPQQQFNTQQAFLFDFFQLPLYNRVLIIREIFCQNKRTHVVLREKAYKSSYH